MNTFPPIHILIGRVHSIFWQKMNGPIPSEMVIKVLIVALTHCLVTKMTERKFSTFGEYKYLQTNHRNNEKKWKILKRISCTVKTKMADLYQHSENEEKLKALIVCSSFSLVFSCPLREICVLTKSPKSSCEAKRWDRVNTDSLFFSFLSTAY